MVGGEHPGQRQEGGQSREACKGESEVTNIALFWGFESLNLNALN